MDAKQAIDRYQRLMRLAVMAELLGRLDRAERLARAAGSNRPALPACRPGPLAQAPRRV